jgi:hypothetical protein
LHASFELKQRINCLQPILDNGAQLFPAACPGVHNLAERHRLPGQISRDGSTQETITVEDADFAHVPRSKRIARARFLFRIQNFTAGRRGSCDLPLFTKLKRREQ